MVTLNTCIYEYNESLDKTLKLHALNRICIADNSILKCHFIAKQDEQNVLQYLNIQYIFKQISTFLSV